MTEVLNKASLDRLIFEASKMVSRGETLLVPNEIVFEGFIRSAWLWKRFLDLKVHPNTLYRAVSEYLWRSHGPRMALALLDLWRTPDPKMTKMAMELDQYNYISMT